MRYKPFGVMVSKSWLFERAGRPVIYQPESEFDLLHETQRFRHKEYDPPSVDFTWEREWRIRTDALELDPGAVSLVVPNREWERWALDQHIAMLGQWTDNPCATETSCTRLDWLTRFAFRRRFRCFALIRTGCSLTSPLCA